MFLPRLSFILLVSHFSFGNSETGCNRVVESSGGEAITKTVCTNGQENSVSSCTVDNDGSCTYMAVDLTRLNELMADNIFDLDAKLEMAEDLFTCSCDKSKPDCSSSQWPDHNSNVCKAETDSNIVTTCKANEGRECCTVNKNTVFSSNSYECCELESDKFDVKTHSCCAEVGGKATCVLSTVTFDDFLNNPNPNPPMLKCQVGVNGNKCKCNVCQNSDEISYDCQNVGRPDINKACPDDSTFDVTDHFLSDLNLPYYFIDPNFGDPTKSPTFGPTTLAPTTLAPTFAPTTFLPTVAPTGPTSEPSSSPTRQYVPNCDGIFDKLNLNNEGYGDLRCQEYKGEFPGAIYACDVSTRLAGDSSNAISLNIQPEASSIKQSFYRECTASAPGSNDVEFHCLDNKDAKFATFVAETFAASFDCEGQETPIYAFPNFNLLQGINAEKETSIKFDREKAKSAFFVQFRKITRNAGDGNEYTYFLDDDYYYSSAASRGTFFLATLFLTLMILL